MFHLSIWTKATEQHRLTESARHRVIIWTYENEWNHRTKAKAVPAEKDSRNDRPECESSIKTQCFMQTAELTGLDQFFAPQDYSDHLYIIASSNFAILFFLFLKLERSCFCNFVSLKLLVLVILQNTFRLLDDHTIIGFFGYFIFGSELLSPPSSAPDGQVNT